MKAIITGGAGFIGAALARRLLADGCQVDICDNFARGTLDAELRATASQKGCRIIERDLLQIDAEAGLDTDYDVVFHLAAMLGVKNVIDNAHQTLWRNVQLTEVALRLGARQKSLKRLFFASTSEIYAGTITVGAAPVPTPESATLVLTPLTEPRTSYMLSKAVGEALCNFSGLPISIVRPHNIFGPRMGLAHVVPQVFQRIFAANAGEVLEVFSPSHTRSFCYIEDAIELLVRILERDTCVGKTLNLGTAGPEISMFSLAELMADVSGKNLVIKGSHNHAGSPSRRCPDMSLTESLTGYTERMPLREALGVTYDWYRRNVFEN